jgi:ketosteroid isomerase-like protein
MDPTPAQRFIDALHALELKHDVEPIVALFAEDAELAGPTTDGPQRGRDGARRFWQRYRHAFDEVGSSFRHVVRDGRAALLEWTSRGRLADGTPFEYGGVSVLELDGDAIRGFRTYFDPTALHVRAAPATAG